MNVKLYVLRSDVVWGRVNNDEALWLASFVG